MANEHSTLTLTGPHTRSTCAYLPTSVLCSRREQPPRSRCRVGCHLQKYIIIVHRCRKSPHDRGSTMTTAMFKRVSAPDRTSDTICLRSAGGGTATTGPASLLLRVVLPFAAVDSESDSARCCRSGRTPIHTVDDTAGRASAVALPAAPELAVTLPRAVAVTDVAVVAVVPFTAGGPARRDRSCGGSGEGDLERGDGDDVADSTCNSPSFRVAAAVTRTSRDLARALLPQVVPLFRLLLAVLLLAVVLLRLLPLLLLLVLQWQWQWQWPSSSSDRSVDLSTCSGFRSSWHTVSSIQRTSHSEAIQCNAMTLAEKGRKARSIHTAAHNCHPTSRRPGVTVVKWAVKMTPDYYAGV